LTIVILLVLCSAAAKKGKKDADGDAEMDGEGEQKKPAFVEYLVDLLMGLLPKPSNLFRDVAKRGPLTRSLLRWPDLT
jgi:hypothetical protein